jgi:hypothetical protein
LSWPPVVIVRRGVSFALSACVVAGCCGSLTGTAAAAAPTATLHVGLSPEQLGGSTTLSFGFTIAAAGQVLPPALTSLEVGMPPGMGVDLNGMQACTRAALLARGASGCSVNSQVGRGSVVVRVPLGEVIRTENAALSVFDGPRQGGHTTLLFYAAGRLPIATQLVFSGVIGAGAGTNAGGPSINAAIPLIPTLPEAPDAAIVALNSTIGTRQRAYYRAVGSRRERITPKGATLPARCPPGGFPFSAAFSFNDTTTTTVATRVSCVRQH